MVRMDVWFSIDARDDGGGQGRTYVIDFGLWCGARLGGTETLNSGRF